MDRLEHYVSNLRLKEKRNMIASILAGSLFSIGWWLAIDGAVGYPSNADLLKASHACGAIGTLALIMINLVTNNQIRGESVYSEGFFGKNVARIWVFLAFLMSFGSLIASIWIFFDYYVSQKRALAPGFSILMQNVLIFASTLTFKLGRSEENSW